VLQICPVVLQRIERADQQTSWKTFHIRVRSNACRMEKIAVDAYMLAMNQYSTRGGGAAADPLWGGRLAPLVLTPSSGHAPASQR